MFENPPLLTEDNIFVIDLKIKKKFIRIKNLKTFSRIMCVGESSLENLKKNYFYIK